jgi:DNA-binding GntR family transcriptional regulator
MAGIMPQQIVVVAAPLSPYEVIAAELRRQFERGELKAGDQLPTVAELSRLHAVSVGTTHRAVALLKSEGLIDVARGRRALVVGRARPCTD